MKSESPNIELEKFVKTVAALRDPVSRLSLGP